MPTAAAIVVRRGIVEEASTIVDVYLASRRGAGALIPRAVHTDDEVRAWWTRTVLVEREVWVAESHGDILGVMALRGEWVDSLYVRPDAQRRGTGGRLIEQAKRGRSRLRLYAFETNAPARDFYEKHGFKAIAYGDGTGNEEGAPDVLYEWRGILR
jgi:GNAT superfamily N-acetyltransferase